MTANRGRMFATVHLYSKANMTMMTMMMTMMMMIVMIFSLQVRYCGNNMLVVAVVRKMIK